MVMMQQQFAKIGMFRSGPGAMPVLAAATFNMVLCFINTERWTHISNGEIIFSELIILAIGLYSIRYNLSRFHVLISGLMIVYFLIAKSINQDLDLKIIHDLIIMFIFFKIGESTSIETGNSLVWTLVLPVLIVGLFELLFTDQFGEMFDAWSYYVDKGVIPQGTVNYAHTKLFISGNRGGAGARTMLPGILGAHRVSSIFLEPDSLGNFAAIVFSWCLSTSTGTRFWRGLLVFLAIVCFVLADSRFALGCCALMLLVRLLTSVPARLLALAMPLSVVAGMTFIGTLYAMPDRPPAIEADNFFGRVMFSARLLGYWNLPEWLGLTSSSIYTADTGYAYFINNLGLPLSVFLLINFAASGSQTKEADMMKRMMAVYFSTSLAIGASVFTIKTAALLWFLYGAANAASTARAASFTERPASVHALWPRGLRQG
jgi:putative polymerase